jgi:hypothetical protein
LYLSDVYGLDLISQIRVEGADSDVIVITAANESGYGSPGRPERRYVLSDR